MQMVSIYAILTILISSATFAAITNNTEVKNSDRICHSWTQKDSNQSKIIANYDKINSLSELLDSCMGKAVFIDLWATWCSPCFEEFKFSDSLYNFLTKNNIEIIYVSFDKETDDVLWRNKINENKLLGNHILANKSLRDNITTLIWGGIDAYSIPNYILFDKNKKLINKHMPNPGTGTKLFKEIEAGLN